MHFYNTLNHNLLLCKLKPDDFDTNALTFIQSYFCSRHQKTVADISLANGKKTLKRHTSRLYPWPPTFQNFY